MALYTNIGGGSKELTSLYGNVGGTRKSISSMYANINGGRKQIFPEISTWNMYRILEPVHFGVPILSDSNDSITAPQFSISLNDRGEEIYKSILNYVHIIRSMEIFPDGIDYPYTDSPNAVYFYFIEDEEMNPVSYYKNYGFPKDAYIYLTGVLYEEDDLNNIANHVVVPDSTGSFEHYGSERIVRLSKVYKTTSSTYADYSEVQTGLDRYDTLDHILNLESYIPQFRRKLVRGSYKNNTKQAAPRTYPDNGPVVVSSNISNTNSVWYTIANNDYCKRYDVTSWDYAHKRCPTNGYCDTEDMYVTYNNFSFDYNTGKFILSDKTSPYSEDMGTTVIYPEGWTYLDSSHRSIAYVYSLTSGEDSGDSARRAAECYYAIATGHGSTYTTITTPSDSNLQLTGYSKGWNSFYRYYGIDDYGSPEQVVLKFFTIEYCTGYYYEHYYNNSYEVVDSNYQSLSN